MRPPSPPMGAGASAHPTAALCALAGEPSTGTRRSKAARRRKPGQRQLGSCKSSLTCDKVPWALHRAPQGQDTAWHQLHAELRRAMNPCQPLCCGDLPISPLPPELGRHTLACREGAAPGAGLGEAVLSSCHVHGISSAPKLQPVLCTAPQHAGALLPHRTPRHTPALPFPTPGSPLQCPGAMQCPTASPLHGPTQGPKTSSLQHPTAPHAAPHSVTWPYLCSTL